MELVSSSVEGLQAAYKNSNGVNGNHNAYRRSRPGSRSLSPFGNKVIAISQKLSYVERVVLEIIETERLYVQDLRSIVEDYLGGIIDQQELLPMKPEQVSALFGNIEDIYALNRELLQDLDSCRDDPVAVTNCFVEKSHYFDIYTQYCNNYPNSVATLTECMRNKVLAKFFREKQEMLNHSLPLGSYLLKPVQRILKYHLLLQEIAKHFDMDEEGYEVVVEAIETMTGVAWYINEMKRKHEHAVRQQEIQSLLLNWKGMDLTTYGELVLEGTFRVQRARSERTFFLFDKALLIAKKRGDHFVYKTHIPCSSLMLIESTRESLCFTVTHYKNNKQQHNLQAKTVEEKRVWTHHLKRLILENHHATIPQKAKEAILEMDAMYTGQHRYSPERIKKIMSAVDPAVAHQSGRRQSEPAKNVLRQLGEKVGLKHAGSDGALLDIGDILQPSIGNLAPSDERARSEGEEEEEEEPANPDRSRDLGSELSASEEEIHLKDDDPGRDHVLYDTSKGFKRQNSEASGNAEKRRSVEVSMFDKEVVEERGNDNSEPEEVYIAEIVKTSEIPLEDPAPCTDKQEEERESYPYGLNPLDGGTNDHADLKTFSSDEDEEEQTVHESNSILPPSVLDQASFIAERFINNISRRSSLALDDGKDIGHITPKVSSRCSSLINLASADKLLCQNGSSDFPNFYQGVLSDSERSNSESTFSKGNSTENVFAEKERPVSKRRESILSYKDRQLLDKIKTYYDTAEHQDASFSIKRRESLTYIPTGVVKNSIFKINSLPRYESIQSSLARQRISSSSSNVDSEKSRPSSCSEFFASTKEGKSEQTSHQTQHSTTSTNEDWNLYLQAPISNEEFKSPVEMIKIWEQIEIEKDRKDKDDREVNEGTTLNSSNQQDKYLSLIENSEEPLIILEDGDIVTMNGVSPAPTPETASPPKLINPTNDLDFSDQDNKTPVKVHPTIMELANCMDEDLSEKMNNKVYLLARQYSQRIKCNKPVAHRRMRELEEDMRRSSLPSVQEERMEEKCKLKPALSIPVDDHGPSNEISPKRLSFSPINSPNPSPSLTTDSRSLLSPVKAEKFHWPDVRELRSRYASSPEGQKMIPVNRSQSVPDRIMERDMGNTSETQNKESLSHSHSMTIKHYETSNCRTEEGRNPSGEIPLQIPYVNGSPEALLNNRNSKPTIEESYYITAEAPLDNNKKVIILEKVPASSTYDLENDDTYVHIRSPTTREKISLKAVIERCKAYQESEEYQMREDLSKTDHSKETANEQQQFIDLNVAHQNRVKNLREKFQTMDSGSSKNTELH